MNIRIFSTFILEKRSASVHSGVECIAETVADEVEGEGHDADAEAGNDAHPGCLQQIVSGLVEHGAPGGDGFGDTEAQVRKAGLGLDGTGNTHGGADDDGHEGIGQDMTEDNDSFLETQSLCGLNEVLTAQREELGPYLPGCTHPAEETYNEDNVYDALTEDGGHEQVKEEGGDTGEHVDGPGDYPVGHTAVVTGDASEGDADAH